MAYDTHVTALARKRRDGRTRERIIQAAIEIMGQEGLEAVSTTRLTRAAGVVQSGFYAHFASVEECLVVAAETIGDRIRVLLSNCLAELRQVGAIDPEKITEIYKRVLLELEVNWKFVEMFIRYFREPTPLGQTLARIQRNLRQDLTDHLVLVLNRSKDRVSHSEVALMADLLVSMTLAAAQTLRWESDLKLERVAWLLANQTVQLGMGILIKD